MSKTRNAFLLVRINAEERAEIQNCLDEVWVALDDVLRINATSRVYENDLAEIQNRLGEVWAALDDVLRKLAVIE